MNPDNVTDRNSSKKELKYFSYRKPTRVINNEFKDLENQYFQFSNF